MRGPDRYRKFPVVIEAMYWNGSQTGAIPILNWLTSGGQLAGHYMSAERDHIAIQTLEGTMRARQGDYIIKGIAGEFYPCRADIFKATYEWAEGIVSDFTPTMEQLIDAWGSDRDGFPLPDDRDDAAHAVAIHDAEVRRREREEIAGFLATEGRRRLDAGQSASTDVSPLLTAAGFALNIMSDAIRDGLQYERKS